MKDMVSWEQSWVLKPAKWASLGIWASVEKCSHALFVGDLWVDLRHVKVDDGYESPTQPL